MGRGLAPDPAKQTRRKACVRAVLVLILLAAIMIVASASDSGDSSDEFQSGTPISLESRDGASERADANLIRERSNAALELHLDELQLTTGARYKLLLFDDLSLVTNFRTLPRGVKVAHDNGPGGVLDPTHVSRELFAFVTLPSGFRRYSYVGIARVTNTGGELKLWARTEDLSDPQ